MSAFLSNMQLLFAFFSFIISYVGFKVKKIIQNNNTEETIRFKFYMYYTKVTKC